jgi:hypothetical protein
LSRFIFTSKANFFDSIIFSKNLVCPYSKLEYVFTYNSCHRWYLFSYANFYRFKSFFLGSDAVDEDIYLELTAFFGGENMIFPRGIIELCILFMPTCDFYEDCQFIFENCLASITYFSFNIGIFSSILAFFNIFLGRFWFIGILILAFFSILLF